MKSLLKVLDIIDTVAELGNVGIRDLSTRTGFPPATTHRIVSTLVKRHYLKQDPVSKGYSLSLRFLELGTRVQQTFNLVSVARPKLEELTAVTKESANLAVRDNDEIVYLDHVKSDYSMLQLFTRLGARVPLYATGVGKMFMSQWPNPEVEKYLGKTELKPNTRYTLVSLPAIVDELDRIRENGYSVDNEEMEEGVRCVAALVYDFSRKPIAAISISGVVMRIPPERIPELGGIVRSFAERISRDLGFSSAMELNNVTIKEGRNA